MRQLFLTLTAIIATILTVKAEYRPTYGVSGRVMAEDGEAEAYATARVYSLSDTVNAASLGVTADDGSFNLPLATAGDYRLIISSVGKKSIERRFTLTPSEPMADLGTMTIKDNAAELGEIEVTARKPLVAKEIDRIGYDVQADEDSKTSTLQDVLRKVPMVTVDSDGTIKVRGSSDFKIYKDGRPNNAFTNNAKDIFAAIPASMIKKIEVITDPGAKEDAEGVGAILNIVTLDNTSMNGLMCNINARFTSLSPAPLASLWLTGNIGKFAVSAHGGFLHQDRHLSENSSESEYRYVNTDNTQLSTSHQTSTGNVGFWGVEASYEVDSLNLLTAELSGYAYGVKATTNTSDLMLAPDESLIYSYKTLHTTPLVSFLDFSGNFNYQRLTRRKDEVITLSYRVSNNRNQLENESSFYDLVNFPAPYTSSYTDSDARFWEHTLQLDWTRPLFVNGKMSTGAKYIYRDNHSTADNRYEGMSSFTSDFSHITTIGALYLDYRHTFGALSARAGLRYEFSRLSAKFKDGSQPDFASNLNDWVPNASVMYAINDANSLKASYSMRINRPGISYLNPDVKLSPTEQSYGNPSLQSVRHNSVNLNYSLIKQRFNVDITASYDFADNAITSVTTVDGNDFKTTTYDNVGRRRGFSLSMFCQWSITDKTVLMFNADVNYKRIKIPGLSNSHWGYNAYMRVSQQLPWRLRLQGFMYYMNGDLNDLYSYTSSGASSIFHGFSLQRSFLKNDKLTVEISAMNPFFAHGYKSRSVTNRGGYLGWSESMMKLARRVELSVGFRFGSVKAAVKKTQHSINNTDLEGGSQAPSTGATNMGVS